MNIEEVIEKRERIDAEIKKLDKPNIFQRCFKVLKEIVKQYYIDLKMSYSYLSKLDENLTKLHCLTVEQRKSVLALLDNIKKTGLFEREEFNTLYALAPALFWISFAEHDNNNARELFAQGNIKAADVRKAVLVYSTLDLKDIIETLAPVKREYRKLMTELMQTTFGGSSK